MILCGMNQLAVLNSVSCGDAERQLAALQLSPRHADIQYVALNQVLNF